MNVMRHSYMLPLCQEEASGPSGQWLSNRYGRCGRFFSASYLHILKTLLRGDL